MHTKYFSLSCLRSFLSTSPETTTELAVVSSISEPPWPFVGNLIDCERKNTDLARESPRYQSVPRMCCRIWACYMILSCSKYSLRPTLMHLITPIKGVTFPLPTFDRHLEVGVETTEEPLPPSNICKHPRHPSHHGIHLRSSSLEGYRTTVCSPNFKTRIIWNGQLEWINKSQAWTFH